MNEIPQPREFLYPILAALAAHDRPLQKYEVCELAADHFGLTAVQREQRIPSGKAATYRHRIGWSYNVLKNAGYATSSSPGHWEITERGRRLLAEHSEGFDRELQRAILRESKAQAGPQGGPVVTTPTGDDTPEERIDAAVAEHHADVANELVAAIRAASPAFFEHLVLDLLHAMGYGTSRAALQQTGGGGDGGIDGVISLDRLGLERVYVQAKRYADGNTVGRPALQAFFGALAGRHANKGVFLTTSSFTRDAVEFVSTIGNSIVLIDGTQLAQLMIEFGVGVSVTKTMRLVEIDSDYFEEG